MFFGERVEPRGTREFVVECAQGSTVVRQMIAKEAHVLSCGVFTAGKLIDLLDPRKKTVLKLTECYVENDFHAIPHFHELVVNWSNGERRPMRALVQCIVVVLGKGDRRLSDGSGLWHFERLQYDLDALV